MNGPEPAPTTTGDLLPPWAARSNRYVPLVCWAIAVIIFLLISLKILSYGFLPEGDARRHVAKALSEKSYQDIVVMRPEYKMDHSPGWDWLLHRLHQQAEWDADGLVTFSVLFGMGCVLFAPFPWLRHPEAWLLALLLELVAVPEVMYPITQGRPFLLTEGILVAVLFSWSKVISKNPSWPQMVWTFIGFCLSAWIHGAWYFWALPLLAFFVAGRWRAALWLAGCWAAGTLAGACLTGRPIEFLRQALSILAVVSAEHAPQWMLVGELSASRGEFTTLALMAIVFLLCKTRGKGRFAFMYPPILSLFLISWILGFRALRFWADWGIPAVLVWLTLQFEDILESWESTSLKRLAVCGLAAAPLFLHCTSDLNQRYTTNLRDPFIDAKDPAIQGWLPQRNGILYTSRMELFYNTFFKNPQADWRYIIGFEPALMPPEDLKIFRRIQWNFEAYKSYEPWIEKMTPADRLAIRSPNQPALAQLEWSNVVLDVWIGRLPAKQKP